MKKNIKIYISKLANFWIFQIIIRNKQSYVVHSRKARPSEKFGCHTLAATHVSRPIKK